MKRTFAKIFLSIAALAMPLVGGAQADPSQTIKGRLQNTGTSSGYDVVQKGAGIYTMISAVINVALSLMGVIFLVLLIYAGYNYMTAGGDEGKVKTAKQTITRAVIGLVIVLLSYAIANFVIPALVCASNPSAAGCSIAPGPNDPMAPTAF